MRLVEPTRLNERQDVLSDGRWYSLASLLAPDDTSSAQAYHVSSTDGAVIRPHYHVADQFQIFTSGFGELGAEELSPVTVHYTDAYRTYGPLRFVQGLEYFTLRLVPDPGASYMPESRGRRPRIGGRSLTSRVPDGEHRAGNRSLIRADDGLTATLRVVGSGGCFDLGAIPASGRYLLVLSSAVRFRDGQAIDRWSLMHLRPHEPAPEICGDAGARLLDLCFPTRDPVAS